MPEEWIEINEIEKLQKQNVLYRYLNATKEVKEIMSAKHKMRELLGENLYVLELKQPTLFRLGILISIVKDINTLIDVHICSIKLLSPYDKLAYSKSLTSVKRGRLNISWLN